MPDMMQIRDERGQEVWIVRPPEQCANGHAFRPGDMSTYRQQGYACWCASAVAAADDDRAWHDTFTCKICGDVTVEPPCSDPDANAKAGFGSSHGH